MSWKNGLAAVFTPSFVQNGDGVFGTAFPVSNGLLLTARHVVRPDRRIVGDRIRTRWWSSDVGWEPAQDDDALVLWECEAYDVALLAHAHPHDVDIVCTVNPLKALDGSKWFGAGYPEAPRIEDKIRPASFGGDVYSMIDSETRFELGSEPNSLAG